VQTFRVRSLFTLAYCVLVTGTAAAAPVASSQARPTDAELSQRALTTLIEAFKQSDGPTQFLAAEYLIWHGQALLVRETLQEKAATQPVDRVTAFRLLAEAQGNDAAARRAWGDRIVDAFLTGSSAERMHALEALARLQCNRRLDEIVRLAREDTGDLRVYARWARAASRSEEDEAALAALLSSKDLEARRITARALRSLKTIRPATLAALTRAATAEPGDSPVRAALYGALFVHSPGENRAAVKARLFAFAAAADEDERVEVANALASGGKKDDLPVLTRLLEDPALRVRVSAAHAILRIQRRQVRPLSPLDWLVIAAYGVGMLSVGWFFSRRTKTTEDYLLGGRNMKPSMVGVSLLASLVSTISYLATPGEIIKHGPVFICYVGAIPIVYVLVGYLLIPYIMRLPVTSAYELLEGKLGIQVRLLGSLIFLLTRLVWMALIIHLSAKALVVMLGWPPERTLALSAAIGAVVIVYTSMGGLRAVILTDVIQCLILFGGAVLSILFVTWKMGGITAWWPTQWASNWDVQPLFSFDPHVRATVAGMILTTTAWWVCTAGSDQMAIQRYLATRDAKTARRAFLTTNCADIIVSVTLVCLGFALLAFFRANPQFLADGQSLIEDADYLFPHFIVNFLPVGIVGLVISGLLSAAMSTSSSGVTSCCSVITVDYINRFRKSRSAEGRHVRTAKYVSVGIGGTVVLLSVLIGKVPGNILEVTNKTNGLFVAPLFGLFFMTMFIPYATVLGTCLGSLYGFCAGFLVGYWDVLTGRPGLSWQLVIPSSMAASIIMGCLLSLLPTRGKSRFTVAMWCIGALAPLVLAFVVVTKMCPSRAW
jgi:SSS family solute:Na+ symporter